MTGEKKPFYFEGRVFDNFDHFISYYQAKTWAVSEKKAMANISCQFKKRHNMPLNAKIRLDGRIEESA